MIAIKRSRSGILKNKKGDFQSLLYILILIFVIGFIFIFVNRLNHELNTKMTDIFLNSTSLQNSTAVTSLQKIRSVDDVAWDYGFLAIYIAGIAALGITAYSTRISAVFFWVYGLLALGVLTVGVMLSNTWQEMAASPEMTETIARFPITDFILGSYAPLAVTAMIIITMILLFGKTPEGKGAFG